MIDDLGVPLKVPVDNILKVHIGDGRGGNPMFFVYSKVLWTLFMPSNVLTITIGLGLLATATRFRRIGQCVLVAGSIGLLACGIGPLGVWIVRPLEERFARPSANLAPPDGVIVLGGAINEWMLQDRGVLLPVGARLTETVALARRFPRARIVFASGSGSPLPTTIHESDAARLFFQAMGLESDRVIYETHSRTTSENAMETRALVSPKPGERWLLVTSASHMPRAVGAFRHAGFDVIAWPADYSTFGGSTELVAVPPNVGAALSLLDIGTKEWIGLFAYWLTNRTDQLFPSPD